MIANAAAENVLGTLGAVCWSIQLVPQIWKSWKMSNTAGLSASMLAIWFVGGVFLGAYVILENLSIPLIIQPQCFCLLSAICWAQCLHYDQGKSKRFAITTSAIAIVLAGGVEAMLIFTARYATEHHGDTRPTTAFGIISAIFIAMGLVPQYIEIFKYKAVIGISLIFLLVDLLGGLFSTLSLLFAKGKFDIIASLSYAIVVVLELGVFALVPILNPTHRRKLAAQRQRDEEDLAGHTTTAVSSQAVSIRAPQEAEHSRGRKKTRGEQELERPLGWLEQSRLGEESPVRRPESVERMRDESAERGRSTLRS